VTPPEGPAQGRHKAVSMPKACGRDNCTPRWRGRQAGSAGIGRNPRSARSVAHSGWARDTGSKNRCNPQFHCRRLTFPGSTAGIGAACGLVVSGSAPQGGFRGDAGGVPWPYTK